ncbi:craniofacial development protein 2-like [Plakobranchus ocellatus]|uniref:Craniofacial development protein 2-like n=1 Tax=Plakobranchus ocellatus TaxID=259542 RepID=A0AAV4BL18_9GAST|nr:craniofacial development protein 2-like [Plakobranchus ocellatus]
MPDQHQATVSNKTTLIIETWNVQILYQKGKLNSIRKEMKRMNVHIFGLSAVPWKGGGETKGQDCTRENDYQRGVCLLLDNDCSKALKGFWAVNDRIIVAKLNGKPFYIAIIQAYAPTADKQWQKKVVRGEKTECMVVSKKGEITTCNTGCNGGNIKQTYQFKYLGFLITSDTRCETEIKKSIAIAKNALNNPQQGDLKLTGPPSGQGAGGGARTRDRKVPADLRADSLATVPPTPHRTYDMRFLCI